MIELLVAGGALLVARLFADMGLLGIATGVVVGMTLATRHPDMAVSIDAMVRVSIARSHQLLHRAAEALRDPPAQLPFGTATATTSTSAP